MSEQVTTEAEIVIEPQLRVEHIFRDIWRFRDLLWILAERDVRLRYKQTVIGVAWIVLQPLLASLIFALIFGVFARIPSDGQPYLLFVLCGMTAWNFFSSILQRAGNSLVGNGFLITKVYFPRAIIPLAAGLGSLVDLIVSLTVVFGALTLYHICPGWRVLALPLFCIMLIVAAVGASLWLSALMVYYRDFMHAMPFILQIWMYITPVVYAASLVPAEWIIYFSLNPAFVFVEGFRWAILGSNVLTWPMVMVGTASSIFLLVSGVIYFYSVERNFADVV
ncbi:MAG: ABC transporter permease [Candidatus Omnitrophica bacterium]|nr:ABC transporter permease [Candidatus Omnitrophota bacterium]